MKKYKKELFVVLLLCLAIAGTLAYSTTQPEYDLLSRVADVSSPMQLPQPTDSEKTEESSEEGETSNAKNNADATLENALSGFDIPGKESKNEDPGTKEAENNSMIGNTKNKADRLYEEEPAVHSLERPKYDPEQYVKAVDLSKVMIDPPGISPVTQEDIEDKIRQIFRNKELWVRTEAAAKKEDLVEIDYVCKAEGKEIRKEEKKGIVLGEYYFPEKFESAIEGLRIGESATVLISYPEDYAYTELAGKDAEYTITVKNVSRVPDITDKFVQKASDGIYQTVGEYEAYIRDILEKNNQMEAQIAYENTFLQKALENCKVTEFPEEVLKYDLEERYIYYHEMADIMEQEFSEYLENQLGLTEKEFADSEAEAVKTDLEYEMKILALAKKNDMWVKDEDLKDRTAEAAMENGYLSSAALLDNQSEYYLRAILARMDISKYALQMVGLETREETTDISVSTAPAAETKKGNR